MYNIERMDEIMNILLREKSVGVTKLAEMLFVSQPTIRRDLGELERQGKVVRTHGGAVLRRTAECEIPLILREDSNGKSKRIIAERASRLVNDGDVVFLDASSTAAHIVPFLKKLNDVIAVTNSPKTSMKLGEAGIKNYCTGGLLLPHSVAYVGNEAESFVSKLNADLFFFSSRGYTSDGFITDSSAEEAAMKSAMMKNARRSYYLVDSSKRGKTYMFNICSVDDVTGVISDD